MVVATYTENQRNNEYNFRAKSRKFYFQWRQLNIYTSIFFLEKDACISACKYELNDDD